MHVGDFTVNNAEVGGRVIQSIDVLEQPEVSLHAANSLPITLHLFCNHETPVDVGPG